MKKLISILMVVMMLASVAAVNTSAAGQILVQDPFNTFDESIWLAEGTAFYVEEGWCKGWSLARVHQTNFLEEYGGNKMWKECSVSVDVAFFDYDSSGGGFGASIWWRDYYVDPDTGDDTTGTIYTVNFLLESRQVTLRATSRLDGSEDEDVAVYDLPEDFEVVVNETNPTVINLGMRVQGNQIDGFLNGEKVVSYTNATPVGTMKASPIVLWNSGSGMYMGFDNFTVATPDYPLFASDTASEATDTTAPNGEAGTTAAPETSVKTEAVVVGTDKDGNDVTEIVTVAPADTVTGGSAGGNGANTGDMALIVVAVMIVALGTAIVVKKVNVK